MHDVDTTATIGNLRPFAVERLPRFGEHDQMAPNLARYLSKQRLSPLRQT